jgi:hypothetical protein
MIYLYPRLGTAIASKLIAQYSSYSPRLLVSYSATSHPQASAYPTGVQASVPKQVLEKLQISIRDVASSYGYPDQSRTRTATPFDQQVGSVLSETMDILPADAAQEEVWSFLSLIVLPDVAFWRWPNAGAKENYERILGRPRNAFRRLWWRSYCIGDDLASQLLEDEAVGIMERPTFGSCRPVARVIARTHLRFVLENPAVPRTELLRQAMKRLRRISPIVTLYALPAADLDALVEEIFSEALRWAG